MHGMLSCRTPNDVDSYEPRHIAKKSTKSQPKAKPWIADLKLLDFDKRALLNPVGWLTDSIVKCSPTVA